MTEKAKILIYDLEVSTTKLEVETYSLKQYSPYLSHKDIVRDYAIHGVAYKWLGDEFTKCISVSPRAPFNDEMIVRTFHDIVSQADIIIGHNVDQFDIKKLNTRFLKYDLPSIPKVQSIDTLKVARKHFKLTSNSLSYLAKFLDLDIEKDESPDWEAIRSGDATALEYMRKYNKRDVEVTEKIYLRLRSWMDNHPNLNTIAPIKDVSGAPVMCCDTCQSPRLVKNGFKYNKNSVFQKWSCKDCGCYTKRKIEK